jgi:hypothetical protein
MRVVAPPSQNGTTDSHRDRGLRSGLVRDTRRRATTEESVMSNCTRYLGLDLHAETITAAIAEGRRQIRSLGKFPASVLATTRRRPAISSIRRRGVMSESRFIPLPSHDWPTPCRSAASPLPSRRFDSTRCPCGGIAATALCQPRGQKQPRESAALRCFPSRTAPIAVPWSDLPVLACKGFRWFAFRY